MEEKKKYVDYHKSYVSEFLSLKCAGDVLTTCAPINSVEKEISESMGIIKRLRPIVLAEPMKYRVLDLCAGNALTSVLSVHLLPIKSALAIDIKPRERPGFGSVKRFNYIRGNILFGHYEHASNTDIIISSHPCKLARRVVEIYNRSPAKALILIPCCEGPLVRKYPQFVKEKLGAYFRWCWDLAQDCGGDVFVDKRILSPKNIVVVAKRDNNAVKKA